MIRALTYAILEREAFGNVRHSLARGLEHPKLRVYSPTQRRLTHSILGRKWYVYERKGQLVRKQHSLRAISRRRALCQSTRGRDRWS